MYSVSSALFSAGGRGVRKSPLLAALAAVVLAVPAFSQGVGAPAAKPAGDSSKLKRDFSKINQIPDMHSVSAVKKHLAELKADNAKQLRAMKKDPKSPKLGSIAFRRFEKTLEKRVDFLDAYLAYLKQRAFPNDRVDWSAYSRGIGQRERMPKPVKAGIGVMASPPPASDSWEFVGPRNMLSTKSFGGGPGYISGRVNAVAFGNSDGTSATVNKMYLGSSSGGVWKSTDAGTTWKPVSDFLPTLNISALAVDPTDDEIVYAGTGDFHGFEGHAAGVMKSTDGGNTWIQLGKNDFGTVPISKIIVDPDRPEWITVTTGRGSAQGFIWRSVDGGATWAHAFGVGTTWYGMAVSANVGTEEVPNRHYYAVGRRAIAVSFNSGQTWSSRAIPTTMNLRSTSDIAVAPLFPDWLYVLDTAEEKIFLSPDAGFSWFDITGNFPDDGWGQAWYDYHIASSSSFVDDIIYVGLIDLVQSPNTGGSWRSIGLAYTGDDQTHVDQHSFAISPANPNVSIFGNDGGVYGLNFTPSVDEWSFSTSMNKTLGVTQFYRAAYHPSDPNKMLGGTQDNSTPALINDVNNWNNVAFGDGGFCEINPIKPNIQYATSQFLRIYRTQDEWQTLDEITPFVFDPVGFIAPIALDPGKPHLLYAGTNYLYKWNDNQFTWFGPLGNKQLSEFGVVNYIAVAPGDSNRIYTGSTEGEIFMTTDSGGTWRRINRAPFPARTVTSIAVQPGNKNNILVTVGGTGAGHVFRCTNTTAVPPVWQDITGKDAGALPDVSTNSIAIDIKDPVSTYYVGSDLGVFYTNNGGTSWVNFTAPMGLPNVQVNDVKTIPGTGMLNAATYGRGIWRIRVANPIAYVKSIVLVPTTVKGGKVVTVTLSLKVPAPAGGQIVTLSTDKPGAMTLPPSVTIAGGLATKVFTFSTKATSTNVTALITATTGPVSANATLKIVP